MNKLYSCLIAGLILSGSALHALAQTITNFDPVSGPSGSSVTIAGTGFNVTPGSNVVYFGPVRATVTSATATSLTVTVPASAGYNHISVTNLSNNLTGYSAKPFNLQFSGSGQQAFDGGYELATGVAPYQVIAADLDNDGKSDLVTINSGSGTAGTLSVFRNLSASALNFSSKADYTLGLTAQSVEVSDLDGDGKKDLIAASNTPGTTSIFRNTSTIGSISFATKVDLSTPLALSVAAADLNQDGKPDLVVARNTMLSAFKNTSTVGNITFAQVDTAVAAIGSIAIGDMNGDNLPDIVAVNRQGSGPFTYAVSIIKNTSTSDIHFGVPIILNGTSSSPGRISIADLNGDGKLDLAVGGSSLSLFRNRSNSGSISMGARSTISVPIPNAVAVGDIDGDGKPDLVTANGANMTGAVSVFKNASLQDSLLFLPKVDYTTGTNVNSQGVVVADLNGDGRPEIAAVNTSSQVSANKLVILQNVQLTLPPAISSFAPSSAATGSIITIAGSNFHSNIDSNQVWFGPVKAEITAASSTSLAVKVPLGASYGQLSVLNRSTTLQGTSTTSFSPSFTAFKPLLLAGDMETKVAVDSENGLSGLVVADFDGDGKSDIAATNSPTGKVSVSRNNSVPGSFTTTSFEAKVNFDGGSTPNSLAVADLDGDGKKDLITSNQLSKEISVFRNTSAPGSFTSSSFAQKVVFPAGLNASFVTAADINLDGKPELLYLLESSAALHVRRNTSVAESISSSSFGPAISFTTVTPPTAIASADLNGDGKPEAIITNSLGNSISIFNNNSTRSTITSTTYGTRIDITSGTNPGPVAIGDLNGDGKPEIVVGNRNVSSVSVFRNLITSGQLTSSSFASKKDFSVSSPQSVSIADINGDGKPDLIVGSQVGAYLLQNLTTDPTNIVFANGILFQNIQATKMVIPADMDGDSKPDIIVASQVSGISVLRNSPNKVPVAGTTFPTAVGISDATLVGSVNPNGDTTSVSFEYGLAADLSDAQSVPATTGAIVPGQAGITPVTATISGLQPGKLYFYRTKAVNASGSALGNIFEIQTLLPQASITAPAISYADGVNNFPIRSAIAPLQPVNSGGEVPPGTYMQTSTIAGHEEGGFADGIDSAARFEDITNLFADGQGNLFVSDQGSHTIRKIELATKKVTTLAGSGTNGSADGTGTAASFYLPAGITGDGQGNLYVAEASNHRVRKISIATGAVSTLAGSTFGLANGIGTAAKFYSPWGLTYNGAGFLYVADESNALIRRIDLATGMVTIETVRTSLSNPVAIALDGKGFSYILDNSGSVIKQDLATKNAVVLANSSNGANFDTPYDIVTDGAGNLYVADADNNAIKKIVIATGQTTILAGSGDSEDAGYVDGPALEARFDSPMGLTYSQGSLYIADDGNNRVRKISLTGYTISPALPAGLIFDQTTGIISGTPSVISAPATYTISAYNTAGASSTQVTIGTIAPALSGNADLLSLGTNKGTLSPAFTATNLAYTTSVSDTTSSITIIPAAADSTASVKINGQPVARGASHTAALSTGTTNFNILVTAQDTTVKKTYTLAVTVPVSLLPQATPIFNPASGPIAFGTAVTIASAGADSILYTVDGTDPLSRGTLYRAPVTITAPLSLKAVAKKAGRLNSTVATASYIQARSSGLLNLTLSGNPAGYNFQDTITTYAVSFPNTTAEFTLIPSGQGLITVDNVAVSSGIASASIPLTPGFEKTVEISYTESGKLARIYTVKATRADAGQAVVDNTGSVTLADNAPQVLVTSPSQAITVVVPAGTEKPSIDYSALITGGTGVIPQTTVESEVADMAIPASVKVTSSDPSWDGVLAVPTITQYDLPPNTGEITTYGLTIEVGSPDVSLSFDRGIRLLLPGQAGKRAGFVHGGVFAEITRDGLTDSQEEADLLPENSAYKINVGLDLVIWTKAFSKFLTFTRSTDPDVALVAFDKEALTAELIKGSNSDLGAITSALASPLPAEGPNGSKVIWQSDNTAVISPDGTVKRPMLGSGNATVTLTAIIKKGLITETKTFTVEVVEAANTAPTLAAVANSTICYTTAPQNISLSGISPGSEASQNLSLSVSSSNANLFNTLTVSTAANGSAILNYSIKPGMTGSAAITITVKDNGGIANGGSDTFIRTFAVQVNALPAAQISSSQGTSLSKGLTAVLSAAGGISYSWAPAAGIISGQNSAALTVRPAATTTYTVTATNASGCTSTQSFTINVLEDYQALDAMNIVTPNGDGKNDVLVIKNLDMYPNNTLRVFDKAGRQIFVQQNYANNWTGTLNGAPLADGTYYYFLDFSSGKGKIKGFVSIINQ